MINAFHSLLTRDVAVKATTRCGRFRVVAVSTRDVLKEAMTRHGLCPPPSSALQTNDVSGGGLLRDTPAAIALPQLGNIVCAANLWAALLNNEERVRVEFHSEYATPVAESLALGETRAYLQTSDRTSTGDWATLGALRVQRALYGQTVPYVSCTVAPDGAASDTSLIRQVEYHCAQSDGVPTAVLFASSFNNVTCLPEFNSGVMVQPIAASEDTSPETLSIISALQRGFRGIMSADDAEQTSDLSPAHLHQLRQTLARRLLLGFSVHDLFGLATGDWEGAASVCDGARQLGASRSISMLQNQAASLGRSEATDENSLRQIHDALKELQTIERVPYPATILSSDVFKEPPERTWVGWHPAMHRTEKLLIDPATVVRTPLDFFCRCSKEGFMQALQVVGLDGIRARRSANPDMDFRCVHCMKTWRLSPTDWDAVEAAALAKRSA